MLTIIENMIIFGLLGCLCGVVIGFILYVAKDETKYVFPISLVTTIVFMIISGIFSWIYIVDEANKYIAQYESAKYTIESSLQNENLTGYEKVALVNQATQYNQELAGKQYEATRWYNIQYDDRIFELEPINLERV